MLKVPLFAICLSIFVLPAQIDQHLAYAIEPDTLCPVLMGLVRLA